MRRRLLPAIGLAMLLAICVQVAASHSGDRPGYRPPTGFQEHPWGEPLSAFSQFESDPLYVQTAYTQGKTTLVGMECVPTGMTACSLESSLRTLRQKTEGDGFHVLAEYYVAAQAIRFGESGAVLFPVFYQFCAHWRGFSGEVPEDVQSRMRFCGLRMLFRSQTGQDAAASPGTDEVVTDYDRILHELIDAYGEPDNYEKRGLVIIATPDGKIVQPRDRRFDEWRWCSLQSDRDIAPDCKASIVLAFDAATGWGVVMYATRPLWEFAYARHNGGAEDDPLYRLLTGLEERHPVDIACVGSNLCRPGAPTSMRESTKAQFRLRRGR